MPTDETSLCRRLSNRIAIVTSVLAVASALIIGTLLAYVLARRSFPGRKIIDTLIDLPMVLPPAVAGIALLMAFGRRGLIGQYLGVLGVELPFTTAAVVLAQVFVAAPFYVKTAITAFASVERELEQAAGLDGAAPLQVFRLINVPLAWPTLLAGVVMTWARSLGEFGATILFAGNYPGRTRTMPLAIYLSFEADPNTAITLAVILMAFSFGALLAAKGILRKETHWN